MKLRPLTNQVVIEPMPDADIQRSASGLFLVNRYKKATLKYRVLAVGPAGFVKKGKKRVWREPEVEVGDCVIVKGELDSNIVKQSFDDGTGRLVVYSEGIEAKWKENEPSESNVGQ